MIRIPAFRLVREPLDDAADQVEPFRWAGPEVGHRHQLGGEPALLTGDVPTCPGCARSMTFYGQLDSISDQICLADAGIVTVWVCFDCFEAEARIESN